MEKVKINFIAEDFEDYNYGNPWDCPLAKAIKRQLNEKNPIVLTCKIKIMDEKPIDLRDIKEIWYFSEEHWNERIATNLQKLSEMNNSVLYSLELEKL
jgi:hypothetical protein